MMMIFHGRLFVGTCSAKMEPRKYSCSTIRSRPIMAARTIASRVARYYRYTGVPRYLGVPVRYRGIYEYKYSTAVCGHHTVFFLI